MALAACSYVDRIRKSVNTQRGYTICHTGNHHSTARILDYDSETLRDDVNSTC
jgi:hypothetical protein